MTQHYILPTADRSGLAWTTDTMAFFGRGNTSQIEKVLYVPGSGVACSAWGDFAAAHVRDEFMEQVAHGSLPLDEHGISSGIKRIAAEILPAEGPAPLPPYSRGIVVAVLDAPVRLYQAYIGARPVISPALGRIVAGDLDNHGNLFPEYYYERSGKSMGECVLIGIHAMRVAQRLNSRAIGDPNVWVLDKGGFRNLAREELQRYAAQSEALDGKILRTFREALVPLA